jgi:hypothetical protein
MGEKEWEEDEREGEQTCNYVWVSLSMYGFL